MCMPIFMVIRHWGFHQTFQPSIITLEYIFSVLYSSRDRGGRSRRPRASTSCQQHNSSCIANLVPISNHRELKAPRTDPNPTRRARRLHLGYKRVAHRPDRQRGEGNDTEGYTNFVLRSQ